MLWKTLSDRVKHNKKRAGPNVHCAQRPAPTCEPLVTLAQIGNVQPTFITSFEMRPSLVFNLKPPQFPYKQWISRLAEYDSSIVSREVSLPGKLSMSDLATCYADHVQALNKRNDLVAERNRIQKSGKDMDRDRLKSLKSEIKQAELESSRLSSLLKSLAEAVPNLIHKSSPLTQPDTKKYINESNLKALRESKGTDHTEIAQQLGLMESAASTTGSSWYYLMNDGALLEQALVQYGLKLARARNWKFVIPPAVVKSEVTEACGFRPRDQNNEQQVYLVDDGQLCLAGTAEIPLAALYAEKSLEETTKLVGLSRSYRAEAGSRGRDTKGLYRVHEFTKLELFAWVATPEQAETMLHEILELQMEIVQGLGLTARVLNMPANDLGNPAFQKYDIEAWMPGRGDWGEVSSASNCLDFQSRRLHTKFGKEYAQTLNGTAMAVPRVIVAILETFWDGKRVKIPEVLRDYMGKDYIE